MYEIKFAIELDELLDRILNNSDITVYQLRKIVYTVIREYKPFCSEEDLKDLINLIQEPED
jgi:hypothetical protein